MLLRLDGLLNLGRQGLLGLLVYEDTADLDDSYTAEEEVDGGETK
jgi:hypothetical protein